MSDQPLPAIRSLKALAAAEAECTRCPLYKFATQAVPGEGRVHSRIMLVGEQPGDKADIAGRPFVGPRGASSTRRSRRPASLAPRRSSPTRSSISNSSSAASAGCTSGRMLMRSNAATGGSSTSAQS